MINQLFIYSFLILLMYILAGISKAKDITGTANYLKSKVNLNLPNSIFILSIILVIILQLVGTSIILYSTVSNNLKKEAMLTTYALVGFTVLATLIFHPPNDESQYYYLIKNVSIIGGLLLLADKFKN